MNTVIGLLFVWIIIGPVIGFSLVLLFQNITRGGGLGEKISMIIGTIICGPFIWVMLRATRKTQY